MHCTIISMPESLQKELAHENKRFLAMRMEQRYTDLLGHDAPAQQFFIAHAKRCARIFAGSPSLTNAQKLAYLENMAYSREEQELVIRNMIEIEHIHPDAIRYPSGNTLLEYSIMKGRKDFADYLISKGATHENYNQNEKLFLFN